MDMYVYTVCKYIYTYTLDMFTACIYLLVYLISTMYIYIIIY